MNRPLRIFLIAGESSGDFLAATLMRALKARYPAIEFTGIGGSRMMAAGLRSLFPMEELSVMGLAEVLPRLFKILGRIRQTAHEILKTRPDVVITVDSPDFCFRVIKRVKAENRSIPCVHYVAPSVWAWRPGRAKKVAGFLDHILTLLPFEPPYFEEHGLHATFVGHPIVERMAQRGDGARFREKYRIKEEQAVLCMLPGSRMSEISRLLESFSKTVDIVLRSKPDTVIAVPTLPHLRKHLEESFKGKGINPIIIDQEEDKFDCFAASIAALAASGTVSLELALTDTPHIISYRLNPVSAWIARRVLRTPSVNLVNILLKKTAIPELLQEDCIPPKMAHELLRLLDDRGARTDQLRAFREALIMLGLGDPETPSQKAARTVISVIEKAGIAP